MQDKKINILCTRPLNGPLIKEAEQRGFTIDVLSFIEISKTEDITTKKEIEQAAAREAAVVFTSMNAVEAVTESLNGKKPGWKIFCIGNTTRKLVHEYFGPAAIAGTGGTAAELARQIAADRFIDEVFFFCGNIRRDELPAILRQQDILVKETVVYSTSLLPQKIKADYKGIVFFSPSAVRSFFQVNKPAETTVLFAIGTTTAEEIKKHTANKIIIADEPGKENLVQKMMEHFIVG
jgi:uroporphyrinogen-III synthase